MKDLCNSGVAASRQRAALFNLLEKCGGLPTAATMKVKDEGRMMNDETSKRMEIGAPVPAAPTCLGEAVRRRKLPSEGWSGTACSIDYELRAVPEAGAPGGSATCYPQSSISHSRFSRIQAVEKPFYHGWTQMNPARLMPQPQILDCGGNPAEREPRRFWKQPAARKAVSPLPSATAVQIFVIRARSCRIVLRIKAGRALRCPLRFNMAIGKTGAQRTARPTNKSPPVEPKSEMPDPNNISSPVAGKKP